VIPIGAEIIKAYPLSKVWLYRSHVYKWQPEKMTENEFQCYRELYYSGFVPGAERISLEIIRTEFIKDEVPTNSKLLLRNVDSALAALISCGIRHGDLTRPNILIRDNRPILLDFSESRLMSDPRPDKRPEGDDYWLRRTIQEILNGDS
jgi:RIO-like serine/threonine protein kinase